MFDLTLYGYLLCFDFVITYEKKMAKMFLHNNAAFVDQN